MSEVRIPEPPPKHSVTGHSVWSYIDPIHSVWSYINSRHSVWSYINPAPNAVTPRLQEEEATRGRRREGKEDEPGAVAKGTCGVCALFPYSGTSLIRNNASP